MLERIRRRLTLGYVGIFALILLFIGVVAVAIFARQVASQQDELLEQRTARTSSRRPAGPATILVLPIGAARKRARRSSSRYLLRRRSSMISPAAT